MVCSACTDRAACRKAKDCAADPQRIVIGQSHLLRLMRQTTVCIVRGPIPADVEASHARHVAMVEAVVSSDRGAEMRRPHMVGTL